MRRFFTPYQRKLLRIISGNKCSVCGKKLKDNFHADHRVPFSRQGKTTLNNGAALCPDCNQKKGAKL